MSNLKIVERTRDIKIVKRKMEALTQKNEGLTDELKVVNREIDSISRKLNAASDLKKADSKKGLKAVVLAQIKTLDNARESLMQEHDAALDSRIEKVSGEIQRLTAVQKVTAVKIDDLGKHRDSLTKKRDKLAQEIASGNSTNTAKLAKLEKKIASVSSEIDFLTFKEANVSRQINELTQVQDALIEYRNNPSGDIPQSSFKFTDDLDSINSEIEKVESEINTLTASVNDNLDGETLEELTGKHEALLDNRDYLENKIAENNAEHDALRGKLGDFKQSSSKRFSVNSLAKRGIKSGAALGVNVVKDTVKSGFKQADPLSKGINKNDVADTGMESIRFARQGIEKTVKTVKTTRQAVKTTRRTVKTTARTIKTVGRAAANTTKNTVKGAYKITAFTVKSAFFVAKLAVKAAMHIVAALFNPITWIVLGILLVVATISGVVVLMMGGAGGGKAAMATGAIGLGDVPAAYAEGLEFFDNAVQSSRNGFNQLVDAPHTHINLDDRPNSGLLYLQITRNGVIESTFNRRMSTTVNKNTLKNAWDYRLEANDIIAVAYVLLQKRTNADNGTVNQSYNVSFTQAIFDEIIGLSVSYNSTIYQNQTCPGNNCFFGADESFCLNSHAYHAIGLWYYSLESVMNALNFTDAEKDWVELTATGFLNNPAINQEEDD
jgi:prefoldin subunit 5